VGGGCGACWEKIYEYKILVGNVKERETARKSEAYREDVQDILLDIVV